MWTPLMHDPWLQKLASEWESPNSSINMEENFVTDFSRNLTEKLVEVQKQRNLKKIRATIGWEKSRKTYLS